MLSRRIPVSWDTTSSWPKWELEPFKHHFPISNFPPLHSSLMSMPTMPYVHEPYQLLPVDVDVRRQLQYMDTEMRRMFEEMNRKFSSSSMLSSLDSNPETWRLKENFVLENPIQFTRDGQRVFRLEFDARQFKPEEITVRTVGHQLAVHAKHEEKGESKSVAREYQRYCLLPREMNPEDLVSKLSHDGILTVEAPLPALEGPKDKLIPIEHKK